MRRSVVEFIVYGHQVIPGSNVGMHFSTTLASAKAAALAYREALRQMDPTGEPLGDLDVFEFKLRVPDLDMLIDLLNSPESIFRTCLISKALAARTGETSDATEAPHE